MEYITVVFYKCFRRNNECFEGKKNIHERNCDTYAKSRKRIKRDEKLNN